MISLLALFLALLPFSFAVPVAPDLALPSARLGALLLTLGFLVVVLLRRRFVAEAGLPAFFLSGFLFWTTLSLLWADNQAWAGRKILFLWSFIPLYWVFAALLRDDVTHRMRCALLGGAAAAALVGLFQFAWQFVVGVAPLFHFWVERLLPIFLGEALAGSVARYPSLLVNVGGETLMRASAFFPDPHIAAFYWGLLAPLALAVAWKRGPGARWYGILAALLLAAHLLTFSRGGYLGLGLALALSLVAVLRQRIMSRKQKQLVFAVVLVLLAGGAASPLGERFVSSFTLADASSTERLRLWSEAGEHILTRPLGGTGLGNYPLVVKPSADYREPIYAHSLFLDVAVETGLIGLFFFGGFWVSMGVRLWRAWRRDRDPWVLGLFASLLLFLGHGLFETPLFSIHILPLLMLLAAFSLRATEK